MKTTTRRRLAFLLGFAVYFALLWLFWWTPIAYPLKVFVVFLHEISHGVAAVATGGAIRQITLDPALGGRCVCPGGNAFLTLSAGYLGSLAWGGALLELGRRAGGKAHRIVRLLGGMVALLTILFVRGWFGMLFGLGFGLGLVWIAGRLASSANRTLLYVLGLTSCLYAVLDIKGDILDRPDLPSDAAMLAQLTGVPTTLWGLLWIGIAAGVSLWLFLRAYRAV